MFFGSAVVAATNLLVLRELHELRNLPRLPIKVQFYLVLNMVTLKENIDSFIIVMFQDQRGTDWRPGPPDTIPQKFENETFTQGTHQRFPFTLRRRDLKKTWQSPAILYLCLRKPRAGKSNGNHDYIVFEKLIFMFSIHTQKTKSRLFQIFIFRDGLE